MIHRYNKIYIRVPKKERKNGFVDLGFKNKENWSKFSYDVTKCAQKNVSVVHERQKCHLCSTKIQSARLENNDNSGTARTSTTDAEAAAAASRVGGWA